jgi:intracellular multiplication protein IcmL
MTSLTELNPRVEMGGRQGFWFSNPCGYTQAEGFDPTMSKREGQKTGATTAASGKEAGRQKVAAGVSTHHDMAAATELSKNALSRERYEIVLKMVFGMIVVIAVMMVAIVYLATRPVEQRYFSTDPQGRIREITALNKPMPSTEQVLNWAAQAVTNAYTMSFANYQQQLDDMRHNFTKEGWLGFEEALKQSGFIDNLLGNQFVTSAVAQAAPIVAAQGLVGEVYAWRIQVPIVVTYQSANIRDPKSFMVEIVIVRRPESENPIGLGIAQFMSK